MIKQPGEILSDIEALASELGDNSFRLLTEDLFEESSESNPLYERLGDVIGSIKILMGLLGPLIVNRVYLGDLVNKCKESDDVNFLLLASYCALSSSAMPSAISILSRLAEVLESGSGMNDREGLYINYHTAHCHEIAKFMVPSDMQKEYLVKATEGYEKVVSSRVFGELPKTKQASILDCLAYAGLASGSMARKSAYEYEQRVLSILSSDGELRSFFHARHALATVCIASLFLDKNIVHGIAHPRREGFKCLKIALEHPNFISHLSYDQQDHVGVELLSLYHSGDGDIAFESSDYRGFVEQIAHDRVRQVLDQPPSAISSEGVRPAEARVPSQVFPMSAAMRGQDDVLCTIDEAGPKPPTK